MDQAVQTTAKIDLAISGMTCASCVARVEKLLRRVPGVGEVSVNLATETARVEAAAALLPQLLAAVDRAGYQAVPRAQAQPRDGGREVLELGVAAALSLPLLLAMLLPLPGWLQLALATPVQFWLGARFYRAGWAALRAGTGNMDLLIALGSSAAYGLSVADLLSGRGPLYFEAGAVVITLVRLGKFLEGRAKREAAAAVTGLARLRPAVAHLADGAAVRDVAVAALRVGDEVALWPGERVPVDGVLTAGRGSLDESHITGESQPVPRGPGEAVLAGALNLDAALRMRVTAPPGESFLDRMARLIDAAQASKPAVQKLADRVSAVFVPVVVLVALATFLVWRFGLGAPVAAAVINAVSVLVIACPCALGLATPAAILAGTGAAARRGILIRDADALERAARVTLVVFDKTGTLTLGRPRLLAMQDYGAGRQPPAADIAAALAAADPHPLALALRRQGVAAAADFRILPGRGVQGSVGGGRYLLGSAALVTEAGGALPPLAVPDGATVSYLAGADGEVLAAFLLADAARPEAATAVRRLRQSGAAVAMLSGDRRQAAAAVAAAVGITDVTAEARPEQKLALIQARRAAGAVVAMVGDGVNDGAALAAADLGIAIGSGADVAIEAADIALLRPDLALVPEALALARRTRRVLRQGLFWAMVYNLVGIPLAACGVLSPMLAAGAMAASSVSVLLNALRLRR